jgi:hypothetical protein
MRQDYHTNVLTIPMCIPPSNLELVLFHHVTGSSGTNRGNFHVMI